MNKISRRNFIKGIGAFSVASLSGWPKLVLASGSSEKRLLVIILRGAMDGLGAIPPVGDRDYHTARGKLALPDKALLPLNNFFAMHIAMQPIHELYKKNELLILHATASPYRERSHFDAQDLLENGSVKPHGLSTGWLGRTLAALGSSIQGLAIGASVPLVLQGAKKVESWTPSFLPQVDQDFLSRVMVMYQNDPPLKEALAQGMQLPDMGKGESGHKQFIDLMATAAKFMTRPDGARIGSIDIGGWDTHANQGLENGRLPQALQYLSAGISAFRTGMGDDWKNTAVIAITEFGRTVAGNGTGGSDHGTATAAFLLGGSVSGGRVIGDWPGLATNRLYQGRDLYPANDLRGLLKGVLSAHLSLPESVLHETIFPQSESIAVLRNLFN